MKTESNALRLITVILIIFVLGLLFKFALRPWLLNWGSTDEEIAMELPGDNIIHTPSYEATRTITIDVKPREIYPWLVQMGYKRAGFYSLDWLNNGFKKSSDILVPEFQSINVGDSIPFVFGLNLVVDEFHKDSFIVWKDNNYPSRATWTWLLVPSGKRETRLISRLKVDYDYFSPSIFLYMGVEVADLPIMRKTLNGIKQRSEDDFYGNSSTELAETIFFLIPFIALLFYFSRIFKKEKWWEPLIMVGFMLLVCLVILYLTLPLWALVLASFVVILTLIGSAAENAAIKQHQQQNNFTRKV